MYKVNIHDTCYHYGKYYYKGKNLEDSLLLYLKELNKEDSHYKALLNKIEAHEKDPETAMYQLFREHITMDFELAKNLNLYDVISFNCFYPETRIGKGLIDLIEYGEFVFILHRKFWNGTRDLTLNLESVHQDFEDELQQLIFNGNYFK
jgi:hypothetical protein